MIIRAYIEQPSGRVGVHAECWLLAGNRPSLLPGKNQEPVGRYDDGGGEGQALCSGAVSNYLTAVSSHDGIHPVVIHVAVEGFIPDAGCGEADDIAGECGFIQAGDNDNVIADAFDPPLKCNHSIDIVVPESIHSFTVQTRQTSPQRNEIACEAEVIPHGIILRGEAVEEDVQAFIGIVTPGFVFEKFLPHK